MSFGGKINPKSVRGGISGTNMPEWMNYVGLQYTPNKITSATGQPSANPRASLYIGNSIVVNGACDSNIIISLGNYTTGGSLASGVTSTLSSKVDVIAITGSLSGNVTPGNQSIGIGSQSNASGASSVAVGYGSIASATNAVAIGNGTQATGTSATALGVSSIATSAGIAIGNGVSSGGSIGIGANSMNLTADSAATVISKGSTITGGTGYGLTIIGAGNVGTNTNNNAYITILGTNAQAFSQAPAGVHASTITGPYGAIDQSGSFTMSAGSFASSNEATSSILTGRQRTTDATPTEIGFPSTQAAAQQALAPAGRIILNNNSSYIFNCNIVARKSATGTDYAMWNIVFGITREAAAANTALVGTPVVTLIGATAGASTWAVAVTADTTNGRPAISLTGQATTTIRWVMTATVTKVTG